MLATIVNCGCWTIQFNPSSVETCQHWRFLSIAWLSTGFFPGTIILASFANFRPGFCITIIAGMHKITNAAWLLCSRWHVTWRVEVMCPSIPCCQCDQASDLSPSPATAHPPTVRDPLSVETMWSCSRVVNGTSKSSEKAPTRPFPRIY